MRWGAAWTIAGLLGVGHGCLGDRAFVCDSSEQCLTAAEGTCEADGWCAYPNDDCDSGRAYGPHAPPSIAGSCVDDSEGGSETGMGSEDSGGSDDGGPAAICGNNIVEPGEDCDDGNRLPNDGCHPQCVDAGQPAWTVRYDGEVNGEDRGFGLALDVAAGAVYVTGFTTVDGTDRDILVQRYDLETGELVWTDAIDGGPLGEDMGEHIAVDGDGNVIVTGVITTADQGSNMWLAKYSPQGNPIWTQTYDHAGGEDKGAGVAVFADDSIIVVGRAEEADVGHAWLQRFDTDGNLLGDGILRGDMDFSEALDVIATGMEYQVTGSLFDATDADVVWTARYTADGTLVWEDLLTTGDNGNAPRGVGQDFDPLGGSAIGGVVNNNILVQRYDDAGMQTTRITLDGSTSRHDEAADVAFSSDGTFVVVGFVDFATDGFARGDTWVTRYAADGTEIWSDRFNGEAGEIDKALGVEVTEDLSAVVVGYETVPGQSRDVWLRRYAL